MRKPLLLLSLATLLLVSFIGSNKIINKWEFVRDASEKATIDSVYYAQLASIDTLTQIPEQILQMKDEIANMSKETIADLPKEMLQMLNFTTLEELKNNFRASIIQRKQQEDSTNANRRIFYEFTEIGLLKVSSTDNLNDIDSSMKFKISKDQKTIQLFGNPEIENNNMNSDTLFFKVLHLSADSLSLISDNSETENENSNYSNKPINFKLFKGNN